MDTIKSSAEISALFEQGRRIHTPYLTLIVVNQRDYRQSGGRVAFIAGKKSGNSVWRNAAKRRMRAVCREAGGTVAGADVALVAKRSILEAPYSEVLIAYRKAIRKLGCS